MTLDMPWLLRRHMRSSGRYVEATADQRPPVTAVELSAGEQFIGWYRNPAPWESTVLAFTDRRIIYSDGAELASVAYDDIKSYAHAKTKNDIDGVELNTAKGAVFIRVAGRWGEGGRFIDALKFITVLQALIGARVAASL